MRGNDLSRDQAKRDSKPVAELINPVACGRIVLVCEHASNHIPDEFEGLGLDAPAQQSHITWDPGAEAVAREMSAVLSAPLVAGRVSRLVYDCNRPADAIDAIAARSELYDVPGNMNLSEATRHQRLRDYYEPFRSLLAETVRRAGSNAVLVTVHSFAPVFNHRQRDVQIGILHDEDSRLADSMLALAGDHTDCNVRRNEPYAPVDGVMHTLQVHGVRNGLANVMLEIRSDLIATPKDQRAVAQMLCGWLAGAIARSHQDAELA